MPDIVLAPRFKHVLLNPERSIIVFFSVLHASISVVKMCVLSGTIERMASG